jgi:hypothetical protein
MFKINSVLYCGDGDVLSLPTWGLSMRAQISTPLQRRPSEKPFFIAGSLISGVR